MTVLPNKGFTDSDGCSSYANSVMQCLLHNKTIRKACSTDSSGCFIQLISNYEGGPDAVLDCVDIHGKLGSPFDQHDQQDPSSYLEALVTKYPSLSPLLKHSISVEFHCDIYKVVTAETKEQIVMNMKIPKDSKSFDMNTLLTLTQQHAVMDTHLCDKCNVPVKLRTQIVACYICKF